MAFRCGFYNAVNHDRTYNATEFGDLFTGLINDGVYATIGHAMTVAPVAGMTVKVRSGRAWFNKTWSVNDSDYPLTIPESDLLLPRIDAVILEVDTRVSVRNNSLRIVTGHPANNPSYPTLTRENGLYQYPLAYITVRANVTSIQEGDIEVVVGRNPTPFVTGIIKAADISDFWSQWDSQFHEWFDELRVSMSGDVAVNLQAQIEDIKLKMLSTDNKASTTQAQTGTSDSVWMTPSKTSDFFDYRKAANSDISNASTDKIVTPSSLAYAIQTHYQWSTSSYPSLYLNDIVSSYALGFFFGKKAATNSEALAGTITDKYITPANLKSVLANYTPSGSQPSISESSGEGIVSVGAEATIRPSTSVYYLKYGTLVLIQYSMSIMFNTDRHYVDVLIENVPAPGIRGYQFQGFMKGQSEIIPAMFQASYSSSGATVLRILTADNNGVFTANNAYDFQASVVYI